MAGRDGGPRGAEADTRRRFAVLDGLRGLAALAVVADHVASPTMQMLTPHRALAVDFFFVLSGFVVMHAYGSRLMDPNGGGAIRFMVIRVVRFWPMLLAAIGLAAFVELARDPNAYSALQWVGSLVFGLAFLPTPPSLSISPVPFPFVGAAYTMFLELFANLLFALVICRLTNLFLAATILVSGIILAFVTADAGAVTVGWTYDQFWGGFPRVVFSFFLGVATYRIWRARRVLSLPIWASFALLLVALCAPVLGPWFAPYEFAVTALGFPLLVLFSAGSHAEGWTEQAMLRAGALSYGFYLLHGPLNQFFISALPKVGISVGQLDVTMYVLVVGSALLLTALLERWYEGPVRVWLGRVFLGRRPQKLA